MSGKSRTATGKLSPVPEAQSVGEDIFRTLLDNLTGCHVFVKDRQSRFVTTNAFHLKSMGAKSLQAVVGRTDFDFFPKDLAEQYYKDEQKVIRTGRALIDRDERMLDSRGREHWLVTTKTPFRDAKGRIIGVVGISRDITSRKRAEEKLARRKELLEKRDEKRTLRLKVLNERLRKEIGVRERAQDALQEEHGRLRAIMDNLEGCHLFVKDRESRFVMTNGFQMNMIGVSKLADVVGKTDFDFFPRELAEKYYADEQEVMRSGRPIRNCEESCVGRNGQRMSLLTTKVPLKDSSGAVTGLVGMSLDVTEVKKASDALTEERNLLRALIDALPMRIYMKDLQSRFFLGNRTVFGAAGASNVVGKTDLDLFPGEKCQQFYDEEQALMRGEIEGIHHQYVGADDGWNSEGVQDVVKLPLRNSKGNVVGLIGINTDVTELRRNEVALQRSQRLLQDERNLLRTLIDNIPHDVYAKDVEGRFTVANAYVAKTMKAKDAESLIGKTDADFYPAEQAGEFRADEERILATGQPLLNKIEPKMDVNGEVKWIVTSKLPLRDGDGKVIGIVAVGIDDTSRKLEEELRHRLEDQLRHAEKMKAIGQLAGGIAHDFNNQLAAIMGAADMIRTWPDDQDVAQHAGMILTASKRAADLTGKLLAFARKGRYRTVPVNMHRIIGEVVALLERSIDKRIRIVTSLRAGEATVSGDPTQLQNALLNIALNARDAMPNEGEIAFATDTVTLDEERCRNHPHELKPGGYIQIGIADTGVGMDEETQRHIFEPFFTTKAEGAGTGMGLAAVYGTVRNHQGSVSFTSEAGHGTEFRIWLPLTSAVDDPVDEERNVTVPVGSAAHILVVDDEGIVRSTLKAMLERLGYKVTLCNDGQEAVEFFQKSWRDVDLVILDMMMPRMGGLDAFLAMKAINSSVRAILSSGYSLADDARRILVAGVRDIVQKPFDVADMSRAIVAALK